MTDRDQTPSMRGLEHFRRRATSLAAAAAVAVLSIPPGPEVARAQAPGPGQPAPGLGQEMCSTLVASVASAPFTWDYWQQLPSSQALGNPISGLFILDGQTSQLFERGLLQVGADGQIVPWDLLNSGLQGVAQVDGSSLPDPDPSVAASLQAALDDNGGALPDDALASLVPDTFGDTPINFLATLVSSTAPAGDDQDSSTDASQGLSAAFALWGYPVSPTMEDPGNPGTIIQRLERAVLRYRPEQGTDLVPLGTVFRGLLLGNVPDTGSSQTAGNPYLGQCSSAVASAPTRPPAAPLVDSRAGNPSLAAQAQPTPAAASSPTPGVTAGGGGGGGGGVVSSSPQQGGAASTTTSCAPLSTTSSPTLHLSGRQRFGVVVVGAGGSPSAATQALGATAWYGYGTRLGAGSGQVALITRGSNLPDAACQAAQFPGSAWIVGNEPNVPGLDDLSPQAYADFLHDAATAIRAADPKAVLVGPNVLNWDTTCTGCGGYPQAHTWSDQLLTVYQQRYGALPLDVWGMHAYSLDWTHLPMANAAQDQSEIAAARSWLRSRGLNLPIWITEFGVIWGYDGICYRVQPCWVEPQPPDPSVTQEPTGTFRTDLLTTYLDLMLGWFTQTGPSLDVERWFLYATNPPREPYASAPVGISLLDSSLTLTVFGQHYRQSVLSSSP